MCPTFTFIWWDKYLSRNTELTADNSMETVEQRERD